MSFRIRCSKRETDIWKTFMFVHFFPWKNKTCSATPCGMPAWSRSVAPWGDGGDVGVRLAEGLSDDPRCQQFRAAPDSSWLLGNCFKMWVMIFSKKEDLQRVWDTCIAKMVIHACHFFIFFRLSPVSARTYTMIKYFTLPPTLSPRPHTVSWCKQGLPW